MPDYSGMTVDEILRSKRAAILKAPLPKGSPSWDDIRRLTWEEVENRYHKGEPGFKTFHKLLTSKRFEK